MYFASTCFTRRLLFVNCRNPSDFGNYVGRLSVLGRWNRWPLLSVILSVCLDVCSFVISIIGSKLGPILTKLGWSVQLMTSCFGNWWLLRTLWFPSNNGKTFKIGTVHAKSIPKAIIPRRVMKFGKNDLHVMLYQIYSGFCDLWNSLPAAPLQLGYVRKLAKIEGPLATRWVHRYEWNFAGSRYSMSTTTLPQDIFTDFA